MINEIRGITHIMPVHGRVFEVKTAVESLVINSDIDGDLDNEYLIIADRPTWQVLRYLQMKEIPHILTDFGCLYKVYNYGISISKCDWVCMLVSDLVFAPNWDENMCKALQLGQHNKVIAVPTLVQDRSDNFDHSYPSGLGNSPLTFDYPGFVEYARKNALDSYGGQGFLTPIMVHKHWINHIGGGYWTCDKFKSWLKRDTECRGGCGYDNDFRDVLKLEGLEVRRALNSFVYHFDGGYGCDPEDTAQLDAFLNMDIFK